MEMKDGRHRAHQIKDGKAVERIVTRHQRHPARGEAASYRVAKRREAMHDERIRRCIGCHLGPWTEDFGRSCNGEAPYLEPGGRKMPRQIIVVAFKPTGRLGKPTV